MAYDSFFYRAFLTILSEEGTKFQRYALRNMKILAL